MVRTPRRFRSRSLNSFVGCALDLPLNLRTALDATLDQIKPSDLSAATRELSARYRRPDVSQKYVLTDRDVLAYAAFRLPATFAAVSAALHEVGKLVPEWHPRSVLDAGAGLGTASWAATEVWPSVADVELIEQDERMIALGRKFMAAGGVLPTARWINSDLSDRVPGNPRDLVLASYVLIELETSVRDDLIHRLWQETKAVLVLVEPGTPAGFGAIRAARARLIELGAHIVAPCPHGAGCPMAGGDWCHFNQRLARSRAHRDAKGVSIGYEDEKFSYVAVSRAATIPAAARVLRHPQVRAGHIRLELCTADGLEHRIVTRRDKERFREARHATWGSSLPLDRHPADQALVGLPGDTEGRDKLNEMPAVAAPSTRRRRRE
jgi:ribosomal protein RSM22 (predicted rRNA methylase)